jgi:hypothetical protein
VKKEQRIWTESRSRVLEARHAILQRHGWLEARRPRATMYWTTEKVLGYLQWANPTWRYRRGAIFAAVVFMLVVTW